MSSPRLLTGAGAAALSYHNHSRPRVTVIVGDNNSGKTALLEALKFIYKEQQWATTP
jgi:recombinational DNA repair ATPase RecF